MGGPPPKVEGAPPPCKRTLFVRNLSYGVTDAQVWGEEGRGVRNRAFFFSAGRSPLPKSSRHGPL